MNSGTNIFGYGIGNDYVYSFRGTLLPYYETDGRYLVHLGASYEHRAADDGHVRVRMRGNIRNGPPGPFNAVYADTTYLIAESQDLLNFEAATSWGPWMLQSEYCFSRVHDATQTVNVIAPVGRGTVISHGGYVELLYFLTGETRGYSKERGGFRPCNSVL
ncbi:MAG: porin [Pirellulales bacterium]